MKAVHLALPLLILCFGAPVLAGPGTTAGDIPGLVSRGFIYEQAPFPECHASTIAETPEGLVAAWFGGTEEKHPDVGIWISRFRSGVWSAPVEVANGVQHTFVDGKVHRHPTWNPVLFQYPNGPLALFWKCGPDPATWWGVMSLSTDHIFSLMARFLLVQDFHHPQRLNAVWQLRSTNSSNLVKALQI